MPLTASVLSRQLEELNLLKHSLLPGEEFASLPPTEGPDHWATLLDSYSENAESLDLEEVARTLPPAHLRIQSNGIDIWFEVGLSEDYEGGCAPANAGYSVSVKGETLARREQEAWQAFVKEKMEEFQDISTHLLPRLHAEFDSQRNDDASSAPAMSGTDVSSGSSHSRYHALFTSHHLVSPNKRRSLQHWSASLSLIGFAKVGHPGVIYCEGEQAQVEEFVTNVKAMQWLALRMRFIEPLPEDLRESRNEDKEVKRRWSEFEKVGEVVEEMRRLRREKYIVEMGIGSVGINVGAPK
ncbi:hypothetical protein EVJ58_g4950 [Rhodofomes roseus]|uniref:Small nuclear ribonucleoprotein Prp3 C-terminal domain-containing protein n=1 Tax=Rhodofomes roseus TaxID=34475 RepID=A0A4Y9YH30_9APHY|nr:hypothetical protein EVJ58_g4950 [Rhodofomes roseus]